MKNIFSFACAMISSFILYLIGDISMPFIILITFMCIDYITGLLLAGIFKKSCKSKIGGLSSDIGLKGLCKKGLVLLMVIVANLLDLALETNYIRNVVIIGFMTNEVISIIENVGLMGVPIPKVINNAIDILKGKGEQQDD